MTISGATLQSWREQALCLRCGRHPAIDKPYLCQPCQREIAAIKKRVLKAAKS